MSDKLLIEDLKRSGLTKADATKSKLKFLSAKQTENLTEKFNVPAFKIPYFDINGKATKLYRLRFLEEVKKPGFKKPLRYWQPANTLPSIYFPLNIKWKEIAEDTSKLIVITEGEKKAIKACKHGIPCFALGGVWNFRSKRQVQSLIPEFELINWKEREVWLVFDSDMHTNNNVMKALRSLAKELMCLGAYVFIGKLPEGKDGSKIGLDDFLLENDEDDFYGIEIDAFEECGALWDLNEEIAFIKNPGAIYQFDTGVLFGKDTITNLIYANKFITVDVDDKLKKVPVAQEWVKWPMRRTHSKLSYAPGKPEVMDDGSLNTWKGWGVKPKKGDIKPWKEFLDYMFTKEDKEFKEWFIKWLAYPIQYPGTKLYTSVVLFSIAQGTGKSFLGYIMGRLYGENFSVVTQEDLHGTFNEWAVNKQFVLGEEISGTDKRSDADRLKHIITRETVTVNIKFRPTYTLTDCINYLLTSNHPDSMYVENSDRRLAIHEIKSSRMPEDIRKKLDKWAHSEEGIAALMYHMKNEVNVAGFNPKLEAPFSAAKESMKQLSMSDLDTFCYNLSADPEYTLMVGDVKADRDLFTTKEIVSLYDPDGMRRTTQTAMSKALRRAGFNTLPITKTATGAKRLWALVNKDKWIKRSHSERVADYDKSIVFLERARSKKFKKGENK